MACSGRVVAHTNMNSTAVIAAERTEQIAEEIVQQLRPTLARIRKESAANGSPEPMPSKRRLGILRPSLFRPRIRAKKAFLFA